LPPPHEEHCDMSERSIITCPKCGHQSAEPMPTNACLFFYECKACETKLKPLPGDCCVFCSYGSIRCPPARGTNVAADG
jgi:hypothetical protein